MTAEIAVLAGAVVIAAAEGIPATAQLAGKVAAWAARRRYAGDAERAQRRAEEWRALASRRPGGRVLGLVTALGFASATLRMLLATQRAAGAPGTDSPGDEGATAPRSALLPRRRVVTRIEADAAVTAMYGEHYRSLVRLAALLVRDVATAEEVVQDSFVAMHGAWRRLGQSDKALSYLRQTVVNRSRSVLRHQLAVDRNTVKPAPEMPRAGQGAISRLERTTAVSALRSLPPRQREALVLKYYADLSEAQIASAMGISRGAVKSHTARAMAALRATLDGKQPSHTPTLPPQRAAGAPPIEGQNR